MNPHQEEPAPKWAAAFGLSLALASVANAVLVVVKEKCPAVQAQMQRLTGSHWATHSAAILLLFAVGGLLGAVLRRGRGPAVSVNWLIAIIVASLGLSALVIAGFYLLAG